MDQDESNDTTKFVRLGQLVPHLIPVSPSTIWRWVRKGSFPAPFKLAPCVTVWRWSEVQAWLAQRAAVRVGT